MVKKIDEKNVDDLSIDHIGVDLWHAALAWKQRAHAEMVKRGHTWYGDARSVIAIHLDPQGTPQSELVTRVGLSKQAVQQLLDSLEAEGIIRRETCSVNRRRKNVLYTKKGLRSVRDSIAVKRQIEAEYRARLGDEMFNVFRAALGLLRENH